MKATIRTDAAAMVPESHKGDRFDYFCRQCAGKKLDVLNVTGQTLELRLPHVQWAHAGNCIAFGIDRISLPTDWVEERITWTAWQEALKEERA